MTFDRMSRAPHLSCASQMHAALRSCMVSVLP